MDSDPKGIAKTHLVTFWVDEERSHCYIYLPRLIKIFIGLLYILIIGNHLGACVSYFHCGSYFPSISYIGGFYFHCRIYTVICTLYTVVLSILYSSIFCFFRQHSRLTADVQAAIGFFSICAIVTSSLTNDYVNTVYDLHQIHELSVMSAVFMILLHKVIVLSFLH